MQLPRVILKSRKARPFYGRHPWVLDTAVDRVDGDPPPGAAVDLFSDQQQWIARGFYNPASRIRVRLYSWQAGVELNDDFWRARLARAWRLRKLAGFDQPQAACRVVFSEADGLSGLIVDRFADQVVIHFSSLAMSQRVETWLDLITELLQPTGLTVTWDHEAQRWEGATAESPRHHGTIPDGPVFIEEHGLKFGVDLAGGQKTGFYLDQRDNRRRVADFVRGRKVLDACCYTGGFALAAWALGGAREVLGVDSSAKAIAMARAHAELNGISQVRFAEADAFETLTEAPGQYGAVILDPPKFARRRAGVDEALRAYQHLNKLAVDALEPDGILVTCSCSGHVTREDFTHLLAEVARTSGRDLQILEVRGAAADHPVASTCLETEYLKCFICHVP